MSALALPYTPPIERDLRAPWSQPWRNCIENEEVNYYFCLHRFLFTPECHRLLPCLQVSTEQPIECEGADYELWESSIWFKPTRESWRFAYRLARVLRRNNGQAWIDSDCLHHFLRIDVAPNHDLMVLEDQIRSFQLCGCQLALTDHPGSTAGPARFKLRVLAGTGGKTQ